jgi:hypothetical protein
MRERKGRGRVEGGKSEGGWREEGREAEAAREEGRQEGRIDSGMAGMEEEMGYETGSWQSWF